MNALLLAAAGLACAAVALAAGGGQVQPAQRLAAVAAASAAVRGPGASSGSSGSAVSSVWASLRVWLRRRSAGTARRAAGVELLVAFAAELRAGQPPRAGLERASGSAARSVCPLALGAARLGGDVPAALRRDAVDQGLPVLRLLAALWTVGEGSGAGLAESVDRLAACEASNENVRRELASELAGPKATAKVLAALPIVGLVMGAGLGGDPIGWLLTPPIGPLVLAAGIALECTGLWWTARLTSSVEKQL